MGDDRTGEDSGDGMGDDVGVAYDGSAEDEDEGVFRLLGGCVRCR